MAFRPHFGYNPHIQDSAKFSGCTTVRIRGDSWQTAGCVISMHNITSVVGRTGQGGQVNYAASKAGLIGMTRSLAREVASRGITVNAVAPGYIETAMTAVMDEKQRTAIMATIPLGRAGTDVEIAELVAFLSIGGCWIHHRARAGCERGMFMGRSFPAHPAAFCSKSRKPAICSASAVERLHMLGLWHGG